MAAFITVVTDEDVVIVSWHVGDKMLGRRSPYQDVTRIDADGQELEHILRYCSNIPVVKMQRVVIWNGETARFIYDNLFS